MKNNSQQAIIDHRRQRVAGYRLRGYTQREIEKSLLEEGTLNPETGKPWSLGTINNDLKVLLQEWKAEASEDIALHKACMLAELKEVSRFAWQSDDLTVILRSLKQQAELLGLDEPQAIKHNDFAINVIYGNGRTNGQPSEAPPEAD